MELSTNLCLEAGTVAIEVKLMPCNLKLQTQLWNFTHYTPHYHRLISEGSNRYPDISAQLQVLNRPNASFVTRNSGFGRGPPVTQGPRRPRPKRRPII